MLHHASSVNSGKQIQETQDLLPTISFFFLSLLPLSRVWLGGWLPVRWGLDAIKTRGESVAIALALVGARPVKEATGRVVK